MRRMSRALCCIAALSAAGSWAAGAEPDRQNIIIDNVVVELSATPEGVTACVDAVHGTKLSGPYGVAITALSGPDAWQEKLPKTVAVEEDYFALPLRIELKRRAGATAWGTLSGGHARSSLIDAGCSLVVSSVEDFAQYVQREKPLFSSVSAHHDE